jgi:prepilin-type N-terminal cleavage/methylation domain-containing protein
MKKAFTLIELLVVIATLAVPTARAVLVSRSIGTTTATVAVDSVEPLEEGQHI